MQILLKSTGQGSLQTKANDSTIPPIMSMHIKRYNENKVRSQRLKRQNTAVEQINWEINK